MKINCNHELSTRCLHSHSTANHGDPFVTPIVQSTTFVRQDIDAPVDHAYARVSNPTVAALETSLGKLEDAPPAVTFTSGLAAEHALFLALLRAGDHVVCGRAVYGGTTRLLEQVLANFGVEVDFVDATSTSAVAAATKHNTRFIFAETPANPTLELTDIGALAQIAHDADALLIVDNTFMTAALQQPLELGADISVYSTTKFIEGHSVAVGGAVVTRDEAILERVRFIRKSTGAIQTPLNAWLTLQGLKTLPLRLRAQSENAARIAEWLSENDRVTRVCYPTFAEGEQKALAEKQHIGAHGAVLSFDVVGGALAARRVAESVQLCTLAEHVGSIESILTHPATMTHADVAPNHRASVGITDGLLRLSVGLEAPQDVIADLDQALARAMATAEATA